MASCVLHKSSTVVIQHRKLHDIDPRKRAKNLNVSVKRFTTNATFFCVYRLSITSKQNGIGPCESEFNLRVRKKTETKLDKLLQRLKDLRRIFRRREKYSLVKRFAVNRIFSHQLLEHRVIIHQSTHISFIENT